MFYEQIECHRWSSTMLKTKDNVTVTIRLGDYQKITKAKAVELSLRTYCLQQCTE